MNRPEFSNVRASFLQRRYAVRLGRRYALAAAGIIILGFLPIHHEKVNLSGVNWYDEKGVGSMELKLIPCRD